MTVETNGLARVGLILHVLVSSNDKKNCAILTDAAPIVVACVAKYHQMAGFPWKYSYVNSPDDPTCVMLSTVGANDRRRDRNVTKFSVELDSH
jgi:hypothetical protein